MVKSQVARFRRILDIRLRPAEAPVSNCLAAAGEALIGGRLRAVTGHLPERAGRNTRADCDRRLKGFTRTPRHRSVPEGFRYSQSQMPAV